MPTTVDLPPSGGLTPYAIYRELGESFAKEKIQPAEAAPSSAQLWSIVPRLESLAVAMRDFLGTVRREGVDQISDADLDEWIEEASQRTYDVEIRRIKFPRHGTTKARQEVSSMNAASKAIEDLAAEIEGINGELCLLLRGFRTQRDVSKLETSELEGRSAAEVIALLDA